MRLSIWIFLWTYTCFAQSPLPYRAVEDWPRLPPGWNFMETAGIAADANNHVYVFHRGPHPIMEFDRDGQFVRSWGDGLFERPHSIRVDAEGNVWTADDVGHTVLKMNRQGKIVMVLGRFRTDSDAQSTMPDGSAGGALRGMRDEAVVRFNKPTDLAVAPNGDVFVADGYGNSRIVKFTKDGTFVKAWGKRGSAPGEFHTPHSIVVDKQNRVIVADRENYRIQIFDADGNFQKEWKGLGSPWGLAITADNHLLMSDGYNNHVLKLTMDGKVAGSFGSFGKQPGQFHFCHQIAAAPDGSVYTAEILNWRPQKFVLK
jgi:DNA-binding beta-propeller fold protein YncE